MQLEIEKIKKTSTPADRLARRRAAGRARQAKARTLARIVAVAARRGITLPATKKRVAITTMQPAALAEQARHAANHARELARLDALHSRHRKPQTLHGPPPRPSISAVRLPLG